jgi:hypothetical protein
MRSKSQQTHHLPKKWMVDDTAQPENKKAAQRRLFLQS